MATFALEHCYGLATENLISNRSCIFDQEFLGWPASR